MGDVRARARAVHGRRAEDPAALYDAARVDGAGPVREFFAVTLPDLRGEIAVALTLTTIAALRNFDLIYITTRAARATRRRCRRSRSTTARSRPASIGSAAAIGITLACDDLRDHASLITRIAERGGAMIARREQAAQLRDPGRVLADRARTDRRHPADGARTSPAQVGGLRPPDGLHFANFSDAWDEGHFSQYLRSSVIVAVTVVAISTLLSILSGYAFGLMRFRGATGALLRLPARADGADRGDDRAALLRLPRPRPDRHLLGADPARRSALSVAFGTFWMRAFFRVDAALAGRGGAASTAPRAGRRSGACCVPFGAAGDPDDDGARLHVDVERVPARARDGLRARTCARRRSASRSSRASNTSDFTLLAAGVGDRRDAGRASSTSSSSGTSSAGCSTGAVKG